MTRLHNLQEMWTDSSTDYGLKIHCLSKIAVFPSKLYSVLAEHSCEVCFSLNICYFFLYTWLGWLTPAKILQPSRSLMSSYASVEAYWNLWFVYKQLMEVLFGYVRSKTELIQLSHSPSCYIYIVQWLTQNPFGCDRRCCCLSRNMMFPATSQVKLLIAQLNIILTAVLSTKYAETRTLLYCLLNLHVAPWGGGGEGGGRGGWVGRKGSLLYDLCGGVLAAG